MSLKIDLLQAPLPPGALSEAWRLYVQQWESGTPDAGSTLARFVELLVSDALARDVFADWCFRLLLDPESGPPLGVSGQWGGGMIDERSARPSKPTHFAVLKYPLTGKVLLPALLQAFSRDPGHYARWLYLFAQGQGYRLPLFERSQLEKVTVEYADDGRLLPLLELGRAVDPRARTLLDEIDERRSEQ